jgi:hypothetical protein
MKTDARIEGKLRARLLLAPRVEGDRLMLSDAVLRAALDGSRPLRPAERAALQASPLTTRRLRTLALERRAAHAAVRVAANEAWHGSAGMLRAADSARALTELATDDRCWRLHFVAGGEGSGGPRVILQLLPDAPFAARLLREAPLLRVLDGAGTVLLAGRLDRDGELEGGWPVADAPAAHFQRHGAAFSVQPAAPA